MLWLLHEVVHPFITVAFPKCHRMLSVGDDQAALRCNAVRHFLTIPQDQAGHVVPIVIEPVQQIHKRRLNPTNPQRFGNKNELLFHLSNSLFSGRIISNAPRSCADSTLKIHWLLRVVDAKHVVALLPNDPAQLVHGVPVSAGHNIIRVEWCKLSAGYLPPQAHPLIQILCTAEAVRGCPRQQFWFRVPDGGKGALCIRRWGMQVLKPVK